MLRVGWVGIGTDRHDANLALFRDVLGMEVSEQASQQSILEVGDTQQLEIFGRDGPGKRNNTPPAIAFEVDDFAAAEKALRLAEVEIVGEPGEWAGHRWLYFRNPDGYLFAIKNSPR